MNENNSGKRKRHFTGGAEKTRIKNKKLMEEESKNNHKLSSYFQPKPKNIVKVAVEVQGLFSSFSYIFLFKKIIEYLYQVHQDC